MGCEPNPKWPIGTILRPSTVGRKLGIAADRRAIVQGGHGDQLRVRLNNNVSTQGYLALFWEPDPDTHEVP